jgi:hypothetical protein
VGTKGFMPTDTLTSWLHRLEMLLPFVVVMFIVVVGLGVITVLILNLADIWRLWRQKSVFIELTPPAQTNKTAAATQRLFSVLHGMEGSRSLADKLLLQRITFSAEIVASREQGIRYVLHVPEKEAESYEQIIASYLPEAKYRRINKYLPDDLSFSRLRVLSFRQTGHFAYPLQTQEFLEDHDPVGYINGAMTQLEAGELMILQLVASPVRLREATIIQNRLAHNEALVTHLGRQPALGGKVFGAINTVLFGLVDLVGDISHGPSRSYNPQLNAAIRQQDISAKIKPARMLSAIEQQLADSVNHKLERPLFAVDMRVMVVMNDTQRGKQRVKDIRNALDAFKLPKYQSLAVRLDVPFRLRSKYHLAQFERRLPSVFTRKSVILSDTELAGVYHFPHSLTAKTENVVKSLSKQLPATLSLKNGSKFDVMIGRNYYHGASTDIGLTAAERERHVFIVGGTGNGKTTLLKYAIVQDIRNGKGVAVIDPHGDLAQELLALIPEERIKDVIYFNPSDLSYPIGLNLLEVPEGMTGDQLLKAKDFIAETVVSIMRKTFSDDGTGGHRIEYVLRNAVLTALTVKDATLFTVYDLLTDKDFRKPIIDRLEQDWLKNFWKNEYGKAGDYQQVKMMAGVTSKIGRYHASVSAERVLEQPKSTINFEEILDGKILICNLAKGLIGEDTSEVFGVSILAKLQLASYMRIEQKRADRRPFFAYVDEFQNFATVSFTQMLSESRKYKLFLIMAEQTTAQQDDENMVNTILTNAGTIICFKSNSLADERQMLHLFNGKVEPGEIANLPAYNFYAKLSGGLEPQDPVSGATIVLEDEGDEKIAGAVIAASRAHYAKEYVAPEAPKVKQTKPKASNIGKRRGGKVDSQNDADTSLGRPLISED